MSSVMEAGMAGAEEGSSGARSDERAGPSFASSRRAVSRRDCARRGAGEMGR